MPKKMVFDEQYILDRIKIDVDGCWVWQRARDRNGYGSVSRISTGFSLAHRLAYSVFVCDPGTAVLRHSCDYPPCCNPDHLLPGTQTDNLADMRERNRGWTPPRIKAVPEVMEQIRQLLAQGERQRDIAHKLNISESYLSQLINRKRCNDL